MDQHPWANICGLLFGNVGDLIVPSVIRRMPLGIADGIWGANGVALTAVTSSIIFNEALTSTMLAGIALIIAGVLTVELGSRRATI